MNQRTKKGRRERGQGGKQLRERKGGKNVQQQQTKQMYQVNQTAGSTCQNSRQLSLRPKSLTRGRWCPEDVYIPPPGDEPEKPTRLKVEATGREVRSDYMFFYPRSFPRGRCRGSACLAQQPRSGCDVSVPKP